VGDCFVIALDPLSGAPKAGFGSGGIQTISGSRIDAGFDIALNGSTLYVTGAFNSATPASAARARPSPRPAATACWRSLSARLDATTGAARTSFGINSSGIQTYGGTALDESNGIAVSGTTVYVSGFSFSSDPTVRRCRENCRAKCSTDSAPAGRGHRVIRPGNRAVDIALNEIICPGYQPVGTTVGTFSTISPRHATFTYTLVPGTNSVDNAKFSITADTLMTAAYIFQRAKRF